LNCSQIKNILQRTIATTVVLISLITLFQLPVSGDDLVLQSPEVRQAIQHNLASRSARGRDMLVLSTAYSYTGNLTKTGSNPEDNYTVAVDPTVIPLGSIVVIDGAAHTATDTGSLIKGSRIDRYYSDPNEAKDYGVQWIRITVYPPHR
jgi:3D (Asp-Asp-Asp) domain-containing protein